MGKICKTCGLDNPSPARNCSRCGAFFDSKEVQALNCGFCGKPNPPTVEICEFCGAYLFKIPPESSKNGVFRRRRAAKGTTSPKDILPPSVEIRVLNPTPVNRVRFPVLPPKPSPPVKKLKGSYVKRILKSIVYGGIYVIFFGLVGWLLVLFLSIFV